MNILHNMLEKTLLDQCSMENMGTRIIELGLEKQGVKLTEKQRKKLSKALKKGNFDNLSVPIKKNQVPTDILEKSGKKGITIDLSKSEIDIDDITEQFCNQIENEIPQIAIKIGEIITEDLMKKAGKMLRLRRKDTNKFESAIFNRWGTALNLLEAMIVIASEAGGDFNHIIRKSLPSGKEYLFEATTRLHARACQVSSEILTLLKAGYADGAHARWRCLHEIAVTMFFLASQKDDTAERYLLHEKIESYKAACSYQAHCESLGYEPLTADEMTKLKECRNQLIERFEKDFESDYGWASIPHKKKKVTFYDIECYVKMKHFRPFYKMASHNVHSNSKGILFRLSLDFSKPDILPAGPSVFGLADPGQNTAISLLQATTALLTIEPNMDCLVACDILSRFADKARDAFIEVHSSFEKN